MEELPPQAMAVGVLPELFEFPPRPPSQSPAAAKPTGGCGQLETLLGAVNVDGKMPDERFRAPDDGEPFRTATVGRARRRN